MFSQKAVHSPSLRDNSNSLILSETPFSTKCFSPEKDDGCSLPLTSSNLMKPKDELLVTPSIVPSFKILSPLLLYS